MKENKIHVGFGFHVNCYHSYRGDSPDNLGFGSDIRIIRKILDTLTELNKQGIAVKGTWDTENFFSLEQILPEFAPDIIEKMKMRTAEYGDEQIIMGYSNGALGAMNEDELEASIKLAVSNENGSGLKDIFGKCEMIVRPQEVMFTPSQVHTYNNLGVKALCLYYSCVPFDAFHTLIPRLPEEQALNPVKYTYKGESLTIIPTYNNADVCDAGCLRSWVKQLRQKQVKNEINNDLFIFINMDADAIFWESLDLPVVKNRIANTDGIHGLVMEVADLPYVVFDTPGGYLKNHEPIAQIAFTQDTADGNFTGFASWAEKPYNRKIWTAIERSRLMSAINAGKDSESMSFNERVLLLSTTHFGLATPVLNIEREKTADRLAKNIVNAERNFLDEGDKLKIIPVRKGLITAMQLKVNQKISSVSQLVLKGKDLEDYSIIPVDNELNTVFALFKFKTVKDQYDIDISIKNDVSFSAPEKVLKTKNLELSINTAGKIESLKYKGKVIGENRFLSSFVTYKNSKYAFSTKNIKSTNFAGSGKGICIEGEIHLPEENEPGYFNYDFFCCDFYDGIFVKTEVKYPRTDELTSISTENSSLGRYSDMRWIEACPFELTPSIKGEKFVVKRNYMGDVSYYSLDSFKKADSENDHLDSFNHQLTAGLVGISNKEYGFVLANARSVLSSMAHCPMRLDSDGTVHMNPFGTYYGKQRHHWSRSKGQIFKTYNLVTPQSKSIAPSYNGNKETAMMAFFGFDGITPDEKTLEEILSFSDGAFAKADEGCILSGVYEDNVIIKEALPDGIDEKKLRSPILTGLSGNLSKYISYGSSAIGHIVYHQIKSK